MMTKEFYGDLTLGILGGGQLGRMLIQSAINYNVTTHILDPDAQAPCKNLCDQFTVGSLADYDTVYNFGKQVDLLTIEIEKVNVDALEQLEKEGVIIYPQPRVIRLIQDKGTQKQFFKDNNIPTADFELVKGSLTEYLKKDDSFNLPFVQKLRRDGYDGKGVQIIRSEKDIDKAFTAPSLVERMVDFEKEIAVMVARSATGECTTFPAVEMEFHPEANLVEFLVSPAAIPPYLELKAENIALEIAEALDIVGLLAVELFVTKDGQILVNELAPRPHNSGHQTIEGNRTSQFEQHLRCIFGMPLGNTDTIAPSVMINVLGEEGHDGNAKYEGLEEILAEEGVYVHLYGKKTTKSFRKMGHITVVDNDRAKAISRARRVKGLMKVVSSKG